MGVKQAFVDKVLGGRPDKLEHIRVVDVSCASAGAFATAAGTSEVGDIGRDKNNNFYLCTVASTTWVKINS